MDLKEARRLWDEQYGEVKASASTSRSREQPHQKLLREIDERTRASKGLPPRTEGKRIATEDKRPSWIRRNFFQTCVVLLLAWIGIRRNFFQICVVLPLAWIGWNLELVVDTWDAPHRNFIEDIMGSQVETDFYVP